MKTKCTRRLILSNVLFQVMMMRMTIINLLRKTQPHEWCLNGDINIHLQKKNFMFSLLTQIYMVFYSKYLLSCEGDVDLFCRLPG